MSTDDDVLIRKTLVELLRNVESRVSDSRYYIARVIEQHASDLVRHELQKPQSSAKELPNG